VKDLAYRQRILLGNWKVPVPTNILPGMRKLNVADATSSSTLRRRSNSPLRSMNLLRTPRNMGLCQFRTAAFRWRAMFGGQMETRALHFCGRRRAAQRYRRLNGKHLDSTAPGNSARTSRLITSQRAYDTSYDFLLAQLRQPTKPVLTLSAQADELTE
jgi:hypothetical protein